MTHPIHDPATRPRLGTIVARGLARRCARCGRGDLFRRWVDLHERCPECGLVYLENQGDPWFLQLLIDRALFILPIIAVLYFGLHQTRPLLFFLVCAGLVGAFFFTTPHRYGICVALDFYARQRTRTVEPTEGGAEPSGRKG